MFQIHQGSFLRTFYRKIFRKTDFLFVTTWPTLWLFQPVRFVAAALLIIVFNLSLSRAISLPSSLRYNITWITLFECVCFLFFIAFFYRNRSPVFVSLSCTYRRAAGVASGVLLQILVCCIVVSSLVYFAREAVFSMFEPAIADTFSGWNPDSRTGLVSFRHENTDDLGEFDFGGMRVTSSNTIPDVAVALMGSSKIDSFSVVAPLSTTGSFKIIRHSIGRLDNDVSEFIEGKVVDSTLFLYSSKFKLAIYKQTIKLKSIDMPGNPHATDSLFSYLYFVNFKNRKLFCEEGMLLPAILLSQIVYGKYDHLDNLDRTEIGRVVDDYMFILSPGLFFSNHTDIVMYILVYGGVLLVFILLFLSRVSSRRAILMLLSLLILMFSFGIYASTLQMYHFEFSLLGSFTIEAYVVYCVVVLPIIAIGSWIWLARLKSSGLLSDILFSFLFWSVIILAGLITSEIAGSSSIIPSCRFIAAFAIAEFSAVAILYKASHISLLPTK
ncbi:hypothetical protein LZD49_18420 [Dyadobacter sp. CY261]|uniref:hypothetical protein n=1 Tax=Dyadobacter sp. CY261 TaxID=2907203 RepID=UPI001F2BE9BF|nr:hypothetical protein [Dyadobacter sp. CY261]MCF0072463.1 hypothetical protein [Dyadobacter sp. CY261]